MKILFGFFVIGVCGLLIYLFIYPWYQTKLNIADVSSNRSQSPSPSPFSLKEAPSESLRGNLTILSDKVLWQDRVATESAEITNNITVQQGEKVETDENGEALIEFNEVLRLSIYSDSSLNIVQTLPVDLVFSLDKGMVKFEKLGNSTISLRVKHLLLRINGNLEVSLDEDKPVITIKVTSGTTVLAYNNLNFETQSLNVKPGRTIVFDDSTRKVVVK